MAAARLTGRCVAAAAALSVIGYAAIAALAFSRYGRAPAPNPGHEPIDRFVPVPEIEERHAIRVAAAGPDAFQAACDTGLEESALARGIFRIRELVMGGGPASGPAAARERGLLAEAQAIGWGLLAEVPGRELVFGAVTQPWVAHPVFRALPAADFAAFAEPGYVKIAWTLRVDPVEDGTSVVRTVTRAATTDPRARRLFRRYWSAVMPGIVVIRLVMLHQIKVAAERRYSSAATTRPL